MNVKEFVHSAAFPSKPRTTRLTGHGPTHLYSMIKINITYHKWPRTIQAGIWLWGVEVQFYFSSDSVSVGIKLGKTHITVT